MPRPPKPPPPRRPRPGWSWAETSDAINTSVNAPTTLLLRNIVYAFFMEVSKSQKNNLPGATH